MELAQPVAERPVGPVELQAAAPEVKLVRALEPEAVPVAPGALAPILAGPVAAVVPEPGVTVASVQVQPMVALAVARLAASGLGLVELAVAWATVVQVVLLAMAGLIPVSVTLAL